MTRFITIILVNICVTFLMLHYFVFSKSVILDEGISLSQDIVRSESKIILSENSQLKWGITLEKWEIILKNNAIIIGNVSLTNGRIILEEWAEIYGNIQTKWEVILEENAIIHGNISKVSQLKKHSQSQVLWQKPNLFVTTNYPDFLKYFDVLPQKHKQAFWYIFVTSHNMDIRWADLEAKDYFQNIYVYRDNTLQQIDILEEQELVKKLFANAYEYINIIPERNIGRFWVWFVTKNYANDKKFADMYLSSYALSPTLFMHETGHVLDYKYSYIDYHSPTYPYPDKQSSITAYWEFHKWEDFAEAYRYYVLHHDSFQNKIKENPLRQDKYDFLKQYVFDNVEYN